MHAGWLISLVLDVSVMALTGSGMETGPGMVTGSETVQPSDTVLAPAQVVAVKQERNFVTGISAKMLRGYGFNNPKDLGGIVPGIHLPDYGASLTSSIYVRGFGSRMENPVIGLYVDDFPVLDKNSYDLDYLDIADIRFLHGPQGTTYGRNTMMGVLSVRTQSPGGKDGLEAGLEYGTAQTVRARLSWSKGDHLLSAAFRHRAGYYRNEYKNALADPYDGLQLRWRWDRQLQDRLRMSQLLQVGLSTEGGFAYGLYKDGALQPVRYNDEAAYRRLTVLEGMKLRWRGERVTLDGMASAQLLADHMIMDQDYTPQSIFTLQQKQLSPAGTLEVILRPSRPYRHWRPMTGVFAFFKYNGMDAPVLFKREGIEQLILANANAHIPESIGYLEIPDTAFPIDSRFRIYTWNAALYHESAFVLDGWELVAGLRLDYEGAVMNYNCAAALNYQMVGMMSASRPLTIPYIGTQSHGAPILLPKAEVHYTGFKNLRLYTSVSKGYRAGGFNTQIFSDILQNQVMNGMMADMGVYMDLPTVSVGADKTEYQPEEAWTLEVGATYRKDGFQASANAFWIEALRQQLTVFPPGKSTGRMMTNAGKSRSIGAEVQVQYRKGGFSTHLSWGWNNARFLEFSDGQADYAGNRIPYSPEHTVFAGMGYDWEKVSLQVHARGVGPIAWNEAGTLVEPFYATFGARVSWKLGPALLYLQGENLTGTRYNAFYFKSMGNEFFQTGKPRTLSLGIQIQLL